MKSDRFVFTIPHDPIVGHRFEQVVQPEDIRSGTERLPVVSDSLFCVVAFFVSINIIMCIRTRCMCL